MSKYQKTNWIFAILGLFCTWQMYFNLMYGLWLLIGVIITYGVLMFWFSMNMQANFFVTTISHLPDGKVMLTFDDGPHPVHTPEILDILKEGNAKALFFIIGKEAEKYPEIVRRIQNEGHLIGGHSYEHTLTFGLKGSCSVHEDIMKGQNLLSELTGQEVKFFRPPFGVTNPQVANCVKNEELHTIGWSVRSFDTATVEAARIIKRVGERVEAGSIVLLHDRLSQTVKALPGILKAVTRKKLALDVQYLEDLTKQI
ncbi:MAG: polysaccharide deacetylase family protein [Reichenbachiella sp.]|uniref:polysaccharide deacetylase family protein n=1 Tax=Reichenbachiella sp. TaxID=2184521 RepID=UPI0032658755